MRSCCSATRSTSGPGVDDRPGSRCRPRRPHSTNRPRSNGRRSGRCATNASNIFRPASCIFSTRGPATSRRIPTAARPATRSRRQSSRASSSWWNGMPTQSGGTIDCSGRRWTSSQFDNSYIRDLQTQFAANGRRIWVLDVTSDLGIPTYVAIMHWIHNSQENIEFGSGAHFDARIALLRTLTELNQFLSIGLMGGGAGDKSSLDGSTPLRLQDHPYLTPSDAPAVQARLRLEVRQPRYARAGNRLREPRQTRRPRLSRARSDAPRHRGPGRQSGRSGTAAFLSPLRAWPALRRSGKARIARAAAAGKRAQSDSPPYLRVISGLPARQTKRGRRAAPATLSARLSGHVALEAHADGESSPASTAIRSAGKVQRRRGGARAGPPHGSAARLVGSEGRSIDKEIDLLVRRLARHGLLEYRLGRPRNGEDKVVIEPQVPDYWPQTPQLGNADVLVLSRFAYMRRRGDEMVLESPRAGALFRICDPKIAAALAMLSTPQPIKRMRRQDGFPGSSFSLCWSIARSCSRSTLPRQRAAAQRG